MTERVTIICFVINSLLYDSLQLNRSFARMKTYEENYIQQMSRVRRDTDHKVVIIFLQI